MSDAPESSDKSPKPIFNPDDVVEPDGTPAMHEAKPDTKAAKADAKAEAKADAKADAKGAATGEVAPAGSEFAGRDVVYVQAPVPPRLKSNRGVGVLLAVLGTAVYAAAFAGAVTLKFALDGTKAMGDQFAAFLLDAHFLVPVLMFLLAFVLVVLIVNRAGWAAHVFGSLVVAVAVYFGTIGILSLLGVVGGQSVGTFSELAANPIIIIGALVAREVSIWMGLAISASGRRVKARNHEMVDAWEKEHADTRAQYERASTS